GPSRARRLGVGATGLQDEDVFVGDDVDGHAAGAGLAGVVEGEERGAGDQPLVAQPGQQRHGPLDQHEAGLLGGGFERAGEVDQDAAAPPGAGGEHHQPAGAQRPCGGGEDLDHPIEQGGLPGGGEVGGAGGGGVAVVPL